MDSFVRKDIKILLVMQPYFVENIRFDSYRL